MSGIIDRRSNPLDAVELPFGYSCAFTGAFLAGLVMKGCGIVTHCSPGCNFSLYISGAGASGRFSRNVPLASTMISEKEVILGGEEALYKTLVQFFEKRPSDFQMLIGGCSPSVTGDDIKAAGERAYKKTNTPVICVNAGGFSGNTVDGYNRALCAIAAHKIAQKKEVKEKTVNLLGVIPVHDLFWKGNLAEIARVLKSAGIGINSYFVGDGMTLNDIGNLSSAALNVVVSDSVGEESAKILNERFGTPYLVCDEGYPVGRNATSKLLSRVCEGLGIGERKIRRTIAFEEDAFGKAVSDYEGAVNEMVSKHRYFLFSDSFYTLGIFKYLTGELGMIPAAVAVTSSTSSTLDTLKSLCARFNVDPFIAIDPDNNDLDEIARETNPTVMIGRGEDFHLARRHNIPLVGISPTHLNRINTSSMPITGYRGALALIDEIYKEISRPVY